MDGWWEGRRGQNRRIRRAGERIGGVSGWRDG